MQLFGLTGGIASGKSTVSARFRARGLPVIDADQIAREIVLPGEPALAELAEAFGAQMIVSGALDRKALAAHVFGDKERERTLGRITHPRIATRTMEHATRLAAAGHVIACYEAALLVENGMADAFRPLVVVSAPESLQRPRIVARDQVSDDDARRRIAAQLPLAEKVRVADHVISNDGGLARLWDQADAVLDQICLSLALPRLADAAQSEPAT